jgi:hypothetical protein
VVLRSGQFLISLLIGPLAWLVSPVARGVDEYEVHFAPLIFAMGCDANTLAGQKKYYSRAPNARGSTKEKECFDTSRQVTAVRPKNISVVHNEKADLWSIVIFINDKDAKALQDISRDIDAGGTGRRMMIGINDGALIGGFLNAPFEGNKYSISATSHDDALNEVMLFVDKVTKHP